MPRTSSSDGPPDLNSKLSTEELIKRLKACLKYLTDCSQLKDANASALNKLSSSLLKSFLHDHHTREVKALTALCLVEIFRLFHPNHPYVDEDLKVIFSLFVAQLKGLESPAQPAFKQSFQLLESIVKLQLFLLCLTVEPTDVITDLFKVAFSVISDKHTSMVKNYLLDTLQAVLQEGENFSQSVLDSILVNIIEPVKSENKAVHQFTVELISRTGASIEPLIHRFFNSVLLVGDSSESELGKFLYDLIFELYAIDSSLLLAVLPQLEYKLTTDDHKERKEVTQMLAKMFSIKGSKLATENRPLFSCFLGRFNDSSPQIRIVCVAFCKLFLLYHPHLEEDVVGKLHERVLDKDERVRVGVVKAILDTAQENMKRVPQTLLDDVIDRLRDKSWSVRKEGMIGLAKLYRKLLSDSSSSEVKLKPSLIRSYSWIPTKLLHCYYMVSTEDRLCVERCVLSCLVPVSYRNEDRMQRLIHVYARLDDNATKAFDQMLLSRNKLRQQVLSMVPMLCSGKVPTEESARDRMLKSMVIPIARKLPELVKSQSYLQTFASMLLADAELADRLTTTMDSALPCDQIQTAKTKLLNHVKENESVKEVLKDLVDATARVLLDRPCITYLVEQISRTLCDCPLAHSQEEEDEAFRRAKKALRLLKVLAPLIPGCFDEAVFSGLVDIVNHADIEIAQQGLQILRSITKLMDPKVTQCLQPVLTRLATSGPVQLAKHAVRCLYHAFKEPRPVFVKLCTTLVGRADYNDPHYLTVLVSLGEVARLQSNVFAAHQKDVIKGHIVQNLLVMDRDEDEYSFDSENGEPEWCADEEVAHETKAKIYGMKLLVSWLLGDTSIEDRTALPVVTLLSAIIQTDGDLQENKHTSPTNMSRLRLAAGCSLLKLSACSRYKNILSVEQFQHLAGLIKDPCVEVRSRFAAKLNKRLLSLELGLGFLSIYVLAGNEPEKTESSALCRMLKGNVEQRRKAVREVAKAQEHSAAFLPEYAIPHAVYLVSHQSGFSRTTKTALDSFRDCLWFFLEPIVVKGDNYGFVHKLLETIKQTVDAQNPDNAEMNKNIYCTCDLSIGVLAKRVMNINLGDFSGEVLLPKKLYTLKEGKSKPVLKYLPPDYDCTPSKQFSVKSEADSSVTKRTTPRKTTPQNKAPKSATKDSLPSLPKTQRGGKVRALATSTPAVRPTRGRPPAEVKKVTPRKRKAKASSEEENELSNIEEDEEEVSASPPEKVSKQGTSNSPRKRNVRRKVLQNEDADSANNKKTTPEATVVDVGKSGASPAATRRSRRKMAQDAEENTEENQNGTELDIEPSPKKRKVKDGPAVNEAKVPSDEAKSAPSGIKRKARHRR